MQFLGKFRQQFDFAIIALLASISHLEMNCGMDLSFLSIWLPDRKTIQSLIESGSLKPSTYNSVPQLDVLVRNSVSAPYDLLAKVHKPQVDSLLEMIEDATGMNDVSLQRGQVLCYEVGGHFITHLDTQINAEHRGTVLIFPPKNDWPFEGGELICGSPLDQITECVVQTHRTHRWNLVYVEAGIEHSVRPVLKGRRIVFKYALFAGNSSTHNRLLPLEPPLERPSGPPAMPQVSKQLTKQNVEDGFCDDDDDEDTDDEIGFSLFE